jgi:peptide/nickel transport system permease protein
MRTVRHIAAGLLVVLLAAALFPGMLTRSAYDRQFREQPNAPVSRQFPLGTDELGRDRLSRLLYGTRISLLGAPAAAFLSMFLAALVGGIGGFLGGWMDRCCVAGIDLMLSLPWLFLLVIVRALLPLNVSPVVSVLVTFGLIAVLGWGSAARLVRATCSSLRDSDLVIQARACGLGTGRILVTHVLPNVRPVLAAQFRTSVPIYVLAEANLGLLGLGVADPIPSWGNLLRPLERAFVPDLAAWAPLVLMLIVVSCFYVTQTPEAAAQ